MEEPYSKRELDEHFKNMNDRFDRQDKALEKIDMQVAYTNGQVRFHTKVLLVVGTAIAVLLITNGSELAKIFELIIT